MYKRRYDDKRYPSREEYRKARRYIWRDEELISRISGSEVTASLANLGIRYPAEVDDEGKVKACSNSSHTHALPCFFIVLFDIISSAYEGYLHCIYNFIVISRNSYYKYKAELKAENCF